MKRFFGSAKVVVAAITLCAAAVGCGKSDNGDGGVGGTIQGPNGSNGSGPNGSSGVSTALPGGGYRITFSASNIPYSGIRLQLTTANFNPGVSGTLALNQVNIPVGQAGTMSGTSRFGIGVGSTISIAIVTNNGNTLQNGLNNYYNYGYYNYSTTGYQTASLSGALDLSATFVQQGLQNAVGNIQGLALDVFNEGSNGLRGTAWVCNQRDQAGYCHGAQVDF